MDCQKILVSSYKRSAQIMLALCIPLTVTACGTLVYVPNTEAAKTIPLDVAVLNVNDAIKQASLLYDVSHFATPDDLYHVNLTDFQFSSDGVRATASFVVNGVSQSCTEPTEWWLGSGPHSGGIYLAGSMPFPDSSQIGGKYCMTMNLIFSDCNFRFICWNDKAAAKQFVDAVTAISVAAGPAFSQALLTNELLPDNYSTGKPLPAAAAQSSSEARISANAGRVDEAIALIEKALAVAPEWPAGHYNLAILLSQEGKYPEAVNEMNTYLALLPTAPNASLAEKLVARWQ